MKPEDPLDSLLQSWQPAPRVPENFRDAVWTRIAAQAEAPVAATGHFVRRRAWLAAAAAVLGFGVGLLAPQNSSSAESARQAYFARINPLSAQP